MHSVKLTIAKILSLFFVVFGLNLPVSGQENSPYSRYGLGDVAPNHNIFTRSMGGISAATNDNWSINFTNPASLSNLTTTIFDVGVDMNFRTLRSSNPPQKFTSVNTYFSYLQIGFPLTTVKMAKKDMQWGMSFGLKPVSKINYKIEKIERLPGIDSLRTLYEGSGGVNQAFIGTGYRIKNFSIGINAGYMFGSKDYSTKLGFINDSVHYYQSNSQNKTTFGGFFINGGMQYNLVLERDPKTKLVSKNLRIGLYGNMQQNLNASNDLVRETIVYDQNGAVYRIDSVYEDKDVKGKIKYPAMVGLGLNYTDNNWMFGADFEFGNWSNYRYYGQADQVQNNWTMRAGAQYYPNKLTPKIKYFNFVKYRAGFYYGSDYITVNRTRPEYGFTLGTGMPLTSLKGRRSQEGGFVILNTALEIGNRGNRQTNLRENIVRFSIGLSMNAGWFQKRKYY